MNAKEAIVELYLIHAEALAEVEKYRRYRLDGGRNERKAEALAFAIQHITHFNAREVSDELRPTIAQKRKVDSENDAKLLTNGEPGGTRTRDPLIKSQWKPP